MEQKQWETHNPSGSKRVIVTKELPGSLWLERLIRADCKVEVCTSTDVLSVDDIKTAIGRQCDAVLGQLTEDWGDELFGGYVTTIAYCGCSINLAVFLEIYDWPLQKWENYRYPLDLNLETGCRA